MRIADDKQIKAALADTNKGLSPLMDALAGKEVPELDTEEVKKEYEEEIQRLSSEGL